ncbi:MAG: hypothetical protein J4F43_06085 [Dehalococcoidia bacterium]|nr:hypothetical protein [Dehalococcoidia bacterium]
MTSRSADQLTARVLRDRKDRENDGYPQNLSLRVHRTISWIGRAEMAHDDPDIAFACYWIAFNAAYAEDTEGSVEIRERDLIGGYFTKILKLDIERAIYEAIWDRFSGPVRLILKNRYVYQPFWKHVNGVEGYGDWEAWFEREQAHIGRALAQQETRLVLNLLFDRLYVLRNQIMHGGSTWNGSVNRSQVRDGAAIMGFLVPTFVQVMMDHPEEPWGTNYYPVQDR